jgi:hypothetical protein
VIRLPARAGFSLIGGYLAEPFWLQPSGLGHGCAEHLDPFARFSHWLLQRCSFERLLAYDNYCLNLRHLTRGDIC